MKRREARFIVMNIHGKGMLDRAFARTSRLGKSGWGSVVYGHGDFRAAKVVKRRARPLAEAEWPAEFEERGMEIERFLSAGIVQFDFQLFPRRLIAIRGQTK